MSKQEPEHVLSLSYGKDSLACLGAIEELGWPLDRIIHAEVWATDTIPADLPPMVDFKAKADAIIKERWGIEVEHIRAEKTYEQQFFSAYQAGQRIGAIYGWPIIKGPWCNSMLKVGVLEKARGNRISYIGIAADEPGRFHNLSGTKKSPLKEAGWTEAVCREWCIKQDLLSPIYTSRIRGGCWFCHNQGIQQLRLLRIEYPEYWELMLQWDQHSPRQFDPHGHTLHDFERRFKAEDDLSIDTDAVGFKWEMLDRGFPDRYLLKALIRKLNQNRR